MKRTLLTMAAAISLGALNFAQAQPPTGPHGGWHRNPLEELSSSLNLTDAEKTKIQPIIDMLYLQERSIVEVQQLTGWTAAKVKVTAFRARQKLRKQLGGLL